MPATCAICGGPTSGRQWRRCAGCYRGPAETKLERLTDRSGGPDACWPWMGRRQPAGYGVVGWRRKPVAIHRLVLQQALGRPIGVGMYALHTCDNKPCVNPTHLYEGTPGDNLRDCWSRGQRRSALRTARRRLSDDQVRALRAKRRAGTSLAALVSEFGLGMSMVSAVARGYEYRDVPE